jgi:dsRNA-specific ribonuclease
VSCQVEPLPVRTEGQGSSRRKAEQRAAEAFLQALKEQAPVND